MAGPENATFAAVDTAAEEMHHILRHAIEQTQSPLLVSIADNRWLFFAAIVLIGFVVSYIFVFLCKTVIKQFTKRTTTDLDDVLLDRLQHPVALSLFLLFVSIAFVPLSLSNTLAMIANKLLVSGNILLIGTIVNRIISVLFFHYGMRVTARTASRTDDSVFPLLRKMISVTVYIIAFLFVLTVWGVQIAPLLAGAGIAGIAIAFALQESLKNIFGGVSLAFDKAYAIGDRVKLNDGTAGTVYDISLRSTKIKTFTGDLMVVPNGKIANDSFTTYAQPTQETVVTVPFSVAYGADIDRIKGLIQPQLKTIPYFFEDENHKATVDFVEMGAFSLNMRVWFWVSDYTKSWDAKIDITKKIYDTLVHHKIEIPYPTQTVVIKKEKE